MHLLSQSNIHRANGGRSTGKPQKDSNGITQAFHNTTNTAVTTSIKTISNQSKQCRTKTNAYNLKIRETMEIRRHKSGPGNGLNDDMGVYLKSQDIWDIWDTWDICDIWDIWDHVLTLRGADNQRRGCRRGGGTLHLRYYAEVYDGVVRR